MSKSSESVWRTAREGVEGLPPRPDDLNEPHFSRPNDSAFIARLPAGYRMRCYKVLPWEYIRGSNWRHHYIVIHDEIADQFKAEYEALPTLTEQTEWIDRKIAERCARDKHSDLCQDWLQARLDQRRNELDEICKQRKEAILEWLAEIGWREETETIMRTNSRCDNFTSHKLARQSKKLTDYARKNIKSELVQWLTEQKRLCIEQHRRSTLNKQCSLLSSEYIEIKRSRDLRDPFPDTADILNDGYFEDLCWDTPLDEEITSDFIKAKLLEHLPRIIDQWKHSKLHELTEIMRRTRPEATILDLQLTTTVFKCSQCRNAWLVYPQMFYHDCCFGNIDANSHRLKEIYYFINGPWTPQYLTLNEKSSRVAKTIVEACSLDPMTTTVQDLWDTNPLIECTSCEQPSSTWNAGRLFMRWPAALSYTAHHDHTLQINAFGNETQRILNAEDSNAAHQTISTAHNHGGIAGDDKLYSLDLVRPEDVQELWYWDPTCSLRSWCSNFRYRPSLAPLEDDTALNSERTSSV
ncbi:hypothetical protein GYMLUDRAFT_245559 [Collybiopsis luxurians FD-317 M1]|uniref:Uncharacterized protein n=1 Tax=Collybiopsis luxurians FD-317 M1 TaxID=944289 RepID=A0A0D0B6S1_9AGAR|nr:hypothetical protein GYMLUDRAFT_245559 [Collybiopsis luxurians FD-317 M1]